MEIIKEYDPEIQKEIDEIKEEINKINTEYIKKLNPTTARECRELTRPGYREALVKEYQELIKPYQERLQYIYVYSVQKIIIKDW